MIKRLLLVALLATLSVSWAAAAPPQGSAYADLPALMAAHPLRGVLTHYDREIAALRQTLSPAFTTSIERSLDRGTAAVKNDAASARSQVRLVASQSGQLDRSDENSALSAVLAARRSADRSMDLYAARLQRESDAASAAFAQASRTRVERAVAARGQQLREKEMDAAYDMARKNAPARLTLRLHLNELHLEPVTRARLDAQLAALSRQELETLSQMQAADAAILARYRDGLERRAAADTAEMNGQLRSKAAANLALRRRVLQAASRGSAAELSTQIATFRAAYPSRDDGTAIESSFAASQSDIAGRFAAIGAAARSSRAEAQAQIVEIARQRDALRRAMMLQIEAIVRRMAEQRHLAVTSLSNKQPRGSIDLTPAVRSELTR